jgi:hypothetical protein
MSGCAKLIGLCDYLEPETTTETSRQVFGMISVAMSISLTLPLCVPRVLTDPEVG